MPVRALFVLRRRLPRLLQLVSNPSYDLVILAAGMGSRFGGLKQVQPIGPAGELIIEYSLYDAQRAGFNRLVLVIRRGMEADFRAQIGRRLEARMDVQYVFQELDTQFPRGAVLPERTKPWGQVTQFCPPAKPSSDHLR